MPIPIPIHWLRLLAVLGWTGLGMWGGAMRHESWAPQRYLLVTALALAEHRTERQEYRTGGGGAAANRSVPVKKKLAGIINPTIETERSIGVHKQAPRAPDFTPDSRRSLGTPASRQFHSFKMHMILFGAAVLAVVGSNAHNLARGGGGGGPGGNGGPKSAVRTLTISQTLSQQQLTLDIVRCLSIRSARPRRPPQLSRLR